MVYALIALSHKRLIEQKVEILVASANRKLNEVETSLGGYNDEVNRIKADFGSMSLYLNDEKRRNNSDVDVKEWVEELIQVVKDLEVKLDMFMYHRLRSPQSSSIFSRNLGCLTGRTSEQGDLAELPAIATSVREIRNRMPEVKLEDSISRYHYEMPSGDMLSLLPHDFKEQKGYADKLEKFMVLEQEETVNMYVYGEMGTGKSRVVSVACDRVKRHFKYFAWIAVHGLCDIADILASVWRAIYKDSSDQLLDQIDIGDLSLKLSKIVDGNKFLFVLDGIDDISVVDDVMKHLPKFLGKIVITTRVNMDLENHNSLRIDRLSSESAEEFYKKVVLRNHLAHNNPALDQQIVPRFEDSLLGIVMVCSLLSIKSERSEWTSIIDKIPDPQISVEEKVKAYVLIGYTDLPPLLKASFLYTCSLFTENCEIPKRKLLRLWLAEGLVVHQGISDFSASPNETVEETAERQLNQLILRNMLEVARLGDSGEVITCRVPGPMRSFVADMFSAAGLNFSPSGCASCAYCRNLGQSLMPSSNNNDDSKATTVTRYNCKRSQCRKSILACPNDPLIGLSSGKFKLLRVLNLEGIGSITKLDHNVLKRLLLLGYLGLRGTGIDNLPLSLGMLQYLQTLDIRDTRVTSLPDKCKPLPKLRHLLLEKSLGDRTVGIPLEFISRLVQLQKLAGLSISLGKELQQLTQLRKLSAGNVTEQNFHMVCTSINTMTCLRSLALKCNNQQINIQPLRPIPSLVKLSLGGQFNHLMDWVLISESLVTLSLWDSNLPQDPLFQLQLLPNLVRLNLTKAYAGEDINPIKGGGFCKLKHLSISRFTKLNNWGEIEKGGLKMLQTLTIQSCPNLKMPPRGLDHLCDGGLSVYLTQMSPEFQESVPGQCYSVQPLLKI